MNSEFRVNGILSVCLCLLFALGAIFISILSCYFSICVTAKSRGRYAFSANTSLGVFKDSAHLISLFCQLIDRKECPNCSLTLKMSPLYGVKVLETQGIQHLYKLLLLWGTKRKFHTAKKKRKNKQTKKKPQKNPNRCF